MTVLIRKEPLRGSILAILLCGCLASAQPSSPGSPELTTEPTTSTSPAPLPPSGSTPPGQFEFGKSSSGAPLLARRAGEGKRVLLVFAGVTTEDKDSLAFSDFFLDELARTPPPGGSQVIVCRQSEPDAAAVLLKKYPGSTVVLLDGSANSVRFTAAQEANAKGLAGVLKASISKAEAPAVVAAGLGAKIDSPALALPVHPKSAGDWSPTVEKLREMLKPPASPAPLAAGPRWEAIDLGKSVEGRALKAYHFGSGKQIAVFLAGFHGDEPNSVELLKLFVNDLKKAPLPADVQVVVCPLVNPDGLQQAQRKNANQVDLNRNFPTKDWSQSKAGPGDRDYAGSAPLSEPESKAVMELLKRYPPSRVVSVHCPYRELNYDGPGKQLAVAMSRANGYKTTADIGYKTPGSFGTYYGKERRVPIITFELPPSPGLEWKVNREALWAAVRYGGR